MLRPETDFIGQADKDLATLTKIFRRYSRCDDFSVPDIEHAKRIFERVREKFDRHAKDNPVLAQRFAKRLWPASDLTYQLARGGPNKDVDIGLEDRTAIPRVFFEIRENLLLNAQLNEPILKRA